MIDGKGNSGVQFRSVRIPHHEMSGYQADIGENYWGSLYDESRRNKVLVPGSEVALKALNKTDWNHYVMSARPAARSCCRSMASGRLSITSPTRPLHVRACWLCKFTRADRWRFSSRT